MTYKLTSGWPQELTSGAFVNPDSNPAYLAWCAAGNTPQPADLPYVDPNAPILATLETLDEPFTPRRMRESMRGTLEALAHLMARTPEALAMGLTEAQVLAMNPAYQFVSQLDDAAVAARKLLVK